MKTRITAVPALVTPPVEPNQDGMHPINDMSAPAPRTKATPTKVSKLRSL